MVETTIKLIEWLNKGKISYSYFPSVSFGCSCALLELNKVLPVQTDYCKAHLYDRSDIDYLILNLNLIKFKKIVKFKLGVNNIIKDGLNINSLFKLVPKLKVRLDINRKWTLFQAKLFAKCIDLDNRNRIDFIEEPCRTTEESLEFAKETCINIAWDESVREANFIVKKQHKVSAIIIKPMLMGSLAYCQFLIEKSRFIGLQSIISSSFESSFGLTQLSRISYWLTPGVTPGLDTISLIKTQLLRSWPGCNIPIQKLDNLKLIWES
ncbi:o-succinylbenzoate synthase [Candidatus Providencia siddallii]|uniref:o-succinylbenzoate synthase n=1 Tax=Candidatus Providencia siddallii TaxID=1715285 RepID=A0A0M6W985_9GAMM|nr:o-succinylbenzoate synthase [Candidatus Providencia siddallii]